MRLMSVLVSQLPQGRIYPENASIKPIAITNPTRRRHRNTSARLSIIVLLGNVAVPRLNSFPSRNAATENHHIGPTGFPSAMSIEELIAFTSKERILLYLSEYPNMEDRYELPADLTQELIAFGTGVQRKHLSQYLNDLMTENLITERKAHIHGMRQRMNGYYLSSGGFARAKELRARLGEISAPITIDGKTSTMRVSEIDDATSMHLTLCDIVREAIQQRRLDMSQLETIEDRKREALEKEELATDTYKRALLTAWHDGRVTATERFLVEELRKHLKITDEQHKTLENEIVRRLAMDHMEFRRIYRTVLEVALADREISGPEEVILENLRRVMRISRSEHEELLKEVELAVCGPPGFEKDLQKEAIRLVKAQSQ